MISGSGVWFATGDMYVAAKLAEAGKRLIYCRAAIAVQRL
jgi:hypothetical protein